MRLFSSISVVSLLLATVSGRAISLEEAELARVNFNRADSPNFIPLNLWSAVSENYVHEETGFSSELEKLMPTAETSESDAIELAKKRAKFLYGKDSGFVGVTDRVVTLEDGRKFLYLSILGDGTCCFYAVKWPRDKAVEDLSRYIEQSEAEFQRLGLSLAEYHKLYDERGRVIGVWDGPIESLKRDGMKSSRKMFFEPEGIYKKYESLKEKVDKVIEYLSTEVSVQEALKSKNKAVFDFIEGERGKVAVDWLEMARQIAELKTALSNQRVQKLKGTGRGTLPDQQQEKAYTAMDIGLTSLLSAIRVDGLFRADGILEKSAGSYVKLAQTKQWLEDRADIDQAGHDQVLQILSGVLEFLDGEKNKTEPNWTEIESKLQEVHVTLASVKDKALTPAVVDYVRYLESFERVLKDTVSHSQAYWDAITTFMMTTPHKTDPGKTLIGDFQTITIQDITPYLSDLNAHLKAAKQPVLADVKTFNRYLAFSSVSAEEKKKTIQQLYSNRPEGEREWMDLGPIAHIAPRFGLKYKVYRNEGGYKMVQHSVNVDVVDGTPVRHVFHTGGHYDMLIPLYPQVGD